jgi:hypothetical protein
LYNIVVVPADALLVTTVRRHGAEEPVVRLAGRYRRR